MMNLTQPAGPENPAAKDAAEPAPVKVWLVDDNDRLRELLAEALGYHKGIVCARHFSSPDALLSELASKPGPDVILLDVQMGERNGLDAVRPIKSITRSTRVLMFTTCFDPTWRERALQDGASDYLLKGSELEHVAERIRCSAHDPAPGTYPRRRAKRSIAPMEPARPAKPSAKTSARFFKRTWNRLLHGWTLRPCDQ